MKRRLHPAYVRSRQPLPTRPVRECDLDLTGRVLGELTVIGLAPFKGIAGNPAAWVVQCSCGWFEHRTARFIRDQSRTPDAAARCIECQKPEVPRDVRRAKRSASEKRS